MTKAENSRVASEPSADRIAADLCNTNTGAASLAPVGGDDTSPVAPANCAHCGEPAPHCQHSDALFAGVVA